MDRCGAFAAVDSSLERALAPYHTPPLDPDGGRRRWTGADYQTERERTAHAVRVDRACFAELSAVLTRLRDIAEEELAGKPQTIDDGVFLKRVSYRFKFLAFDRSNASGAQIPMAVITDVASEYQSGQCLEVGTGRPRAIYVAVPDGDHTYVCRGAVYSYYEFTRPLAQRLDDPAWKRMVQGNLLPPAWMDTRPALAGSSGP
jgi:hypothetical protein